MVTQPGREEFARKAVACFQAQTYDRRELVIVYDRSRKNGPLPTVDSYSAGEAGLEGAGRSARHPAAADLRLVRIVDGGCGKSLGELRNLALESAAGDVVCQWDDDDQSHPERLVRQWETMRDARADACFLGAQFHYFTGTDELFVRDTQSRGIEGTVMHRVDIPVRYPAWEREEDTAFMNGLKRFRWVVLQHVPWLYLRLFHGENTWDEEHHRSMMRETCSAGVLRKRQEELKAQLESYEVPRPLTVCGHDEPAFTVKPDRNPRRTGDVGRSCLATNEKPRHLEIRDCLAGRFNERRVILLTSSPRSGSTLLANVLGTVPDWCVLFEPLQLDHVPESAKAGFTWRTYLHPDSQWPEGESFLRRVFEGQVINEWTCREMSVTKAQKATRMIVKFVRANRLLPWICRTFQVAPPILLVRHPCAVVASQLNFGWNDSARPEAPPFLDSLPALQSALSSTEGDEEHLAAAWALDQIPPLLEPVPHPWMIVTYEELLLRPRATLGRIFRTHDVDADLDAALSRLQEPTRVVSKSGISGLDGWKGRLTDEQVTRILGTAGRFGLSFYGEGVEPDYELLRGGQVAEHIRRAGAG